MPNEAVKKVEHGFAMRRRRRSLAVVSSSVNQEARTVDMIAATETPAIQWVPDPTQTGSFSQRRYVEADEVLGMDGIDFSRARGMPFGDSHNLSVTVESVLGTVIDLTVDGTRLLAQAKFRKSKAGLLEDIEDGHLQQVSIGYCVHEYEVVERTDGVDRLMVRATRWTPHEISLVAVGADPNAVMRSQDQQLFPEPVFKRSAENIRSKERTMDEAEIETLVTTAEDALAALADVSEDGVSDEVKARLATLDTTTPDWLYEDGETLEPKSYAIGDKVQANGLVWLCVTPHEATEQFTASLSDDNSNQTVQLWEKTPKVAAVDARVSSFFDQPRGIRAVRYALRRLNRTVQNRARCATIQADISWMAARDMTCADEARIENRRLPGGQPVGKITHVELRIDGARRSATVKIAASLGTGVAPDAPTDNQQQTSDIVYAVQAPTVNQPVDAFALSIKAPRFVEIENDAVEQEGFMFNASSFGGDVVKAIQDNPTRIRVFFDPLRSENLISRRLTATTNPIYVRKGLDLNPETP